MVEHSLEDGCLAQVPYWDDRPPPQKLKMIWSLIQVLFIFKFFFFIYLFYGHMA
jgi:hypothetical protein